MTVKIENGIILYMKEYRFNVEKVYDTIVNDWEKFMFPFGHTKCVIGISGGKDSTVCAFLASKKFGPENVYGVMMPYDEQSDIEDSKEVIRLTGIHPISINIGDAYHSILDSVENNGIEVSEDSKINVAPRLRMSSLYAVAQSVGGIVINTSNLSEDMVSWATLWGDTCGSYAPIQGLTVTEILELGKYLGIPDHLINKIPADGLRTTTDEDSLGFKYSDLDRFIRLNEGTEQFKVYVMNKYYKGKFKLDMIRLPGPKFKEFPNYITGE